MGVSNHGQKQILQACAWWCFQYVKKVLPQMHVPLLSMACLGYCDDEGFPCGTFMLHPPAKEHPSTPSKPMSGPKHAAGLEMLHCAKRLKDQEHQAPQDPLARAKSRFYMQAKTWNFAFLERLRPCWKIRRSVDKVKPVLDRRSDKN